MSWRWPSSACSAFVVVRGLIRLLGESDLFVLLACSGILAQVGLQAVINMGVNMRLLPAKGITLPFISYGGSSMLALAIGMGFVLALTRTRAGSGATGALRPPGEPRRTLAAAGVGAGQ